MVSLTTTSPPHSPAWKQFTESYTECIHCAKLHTIRKCICSMWVEYRTPKKKAQLERISSIKKCLLFSNCKQKSYIKYLATHTTYKIYTLAHHTLFLPSLFEILLCYAANAVAIVIYHCHWCRFRDSRATLSSQAILLNSNDLLNLSKHKRRAIYFDW